MKINVNPKKALKSVSKGLSKAVKNPGSIVKKTADVLTLGNTDKLNKEKIARAQVDVLTIGNKRLVDQITGGAASNFQGTFTGDAKSAIALARSAQGAYSNPQGTFGQLLNNTFTTLGLSGPTPTVNSMVSDSGYYSTQSGYSAGSAKPFPWAWVAIGGLAVVTLIVVIKKK